jgi:hypothetical protein
MKILKAEKGRKTENILFVYLLFLTIYPHEYSWEPGIFLGTKGRLARKTGNLTAICVSIV